MNRFVIVDGLPFLYADGKTYAVRWDEEGFTVGAEVKMKSVPAVTYNELSIKAKCAACLDSIGANQSEQDENQSEQDEKPKKTTRTKRKGEA
jgi:hypothetical protein